MQKNHPSLKKKIRFNVERHNPQGETQNSPLKQQTSAVGGIQLKALIADTAFS